MLSTGCRTLMRPIGIVHWAGVDVFFQAKKVVIAKQLCPLDSWTFVVEA
jgi:hypothetical protein